MNPTEETYKEMEEAFDFFNTHLFEDKLPKCLITFQRQSKTYGYYSHERFINKKGEKIDEIAMNPTFFSIRSIEETLSTLVHECVHVYQQYFGNPGRGRYHNKEWGDKMVEIGLMPSSTGKEGGKKTGDQVSHYIMEDGLFERVCKDLITTDFKISWADRFPPFRMIEASRTKPLEGDGELEGIDDDVDVVETTNLRSNPEEEMKGWGIDVDNTPVAPVQPTRVKFSCPDCSANAWGKPSLNLICGDCKVQFKSTQNG